VHSTDIELATESGYSKGWSEGFHQGYASSTKLQDQNLKRLEQRIKELEQQLDDKVRIYEVNGDQIVTVDGYSYRWQGKEHLKVGDHVLLPENWLSRIKDGPGPTAGTVTALGTTYRGELSFIVSQIPKDQEVECT
jgi:hypothetical protein